MKFNIMKQIETYENYATNTQNFYIQDGGQMPHWKIFLAVIPEQHV